MKNILKIKFSPIVAIIQAALLGLISFKFLLLLEPTPSIIAVGFASILIVRYFELIGR